MLVPGIIGAVATWAPLVLSVGALEGIKWFRSPAPEGFVSTSTLLVQTSQGEVELLFHSVDEAGNVARTLSQLAA